MKVNQVVKAVVGTGVLISVGVATLVGLNSCAVIYHPDPNHGDNTAVEGGPYSFVIVGENNQQIARHITSLSSCPRIVVDGREFNMVERGNNNRPSQFEQIISCEYPIGSGAQQVSINGLPLAVLPQKVNRIAIIGDTGCRMKMSTFQNCNNLEGEGEKWPFAQLAAALAKENADVVMHMGDYHYRETPCPIYNKGCQGPWGFNWASWQADFFEPAKPLLNKVPWVLTRGNHEDCDRAFKGWFYLLDPYALADDIWQNCQKFTPTYKVEFNDLTVVQMDSATLLNGFEQPLDPKTEQAYVQMFESVNDFAKDSQQTWMITHRPMWAISSYYDWKKFHKDISITDVAMQSALKSTQLGQFDDKVNLLLSGHIHNFEAISFNVDRPSLMVIGDSGTRLSPVIDDEQQIKLNQLLNKLQVDPADFFVDGRFAYVIMERQPQQQWHVQFVSLDGLTRKNFILRGKRLHPQAEH